jgi:exosome complex component RRP45
MPRDFKLSKNEQQFIKSALSEGLRLDGRKFDEYRPVNITFGEEYGSVQASLGDTL